MFTFTVAGVPKGKARPRFWNGRAVTPATTREYEQEVAWSAKAGGVRVLDGPIVLDVIATFPIAESWSKAKKEQALAGQLPHLSRPDADNVLKIVCDSLNGIAWKDDAQVVDARVRKKYGSIPELMINLKQAS